MYLHLKRIVLLKKLYRKVVVFEGYAAPLHSNEDYFMCPSPHVLSVYLLCILQHNTLGLCKIIIWKAQGVPQ